MAVKEYKAEKMFYTMGEITEMFDVSAALVRFWANRFDILKPKRNKKGNRLFTPEDVRNLETIYHLTRERGMTLAGVEKYLKNNREEAERDAEMVRRLQTVRGLLVEIREELTDETEGEVRVYPAEETVETPPPLEAAVPAEVPDPEEFAEEELPGEIGGEEDELFDAEVSEPFTAQPLFELEEDAAVSAAEEGTAPAEMPEGVASTAVDTQQSLF